MTGSRQDAWSADEDITLAEIVLRHVREGSTQLAAFQEAGEKLTRTAAACGFRWNACIRKKYEKAVELAKSRQTGKSEENSEDEVLEESLFSQEKEKPEAGESNSEKPYSRGMKERLQETISFLQELSGFLEERGENREALVKKENIEAENEKLEQELQQIKQDFKQLRQDYKALLEVMDKARALSEGSLSSLADDNMEESS
ncbi:RsfA family transcriptional regulator [Salibacterium sp. K-3]